MNNTITAQDLKTKGVSLLASRTKKSDEIFVTVRGERKFVVLTIEKYKTFKECELESAMHEAIQDIESGKYQELSIEEHIQSLQHE